MLLKKGFVIALLTAQRNFLSYSRSQLEHKDIIITRQTAWGDLAIKEITTGRVGEGLIHQWTSSEDEGE